MRKIIIALLVVAISAGAVLGFIALVRKEEMKAEVMCVDDGWLKVDGNMIVSSCGRNVQLHGISTHGIQWYGDLYTPESIAHLKNEMGIDVFRIAMYTNPDDHGYVADKTLKDKVIELVDASIELGLYVIIDWHILNDNNPQTYKTEALEFFAEMSEKYAEVPNVIYEICNEPNNGAKWDEDIRPYAEEVVAKIRENSEKSLIIVGTPDWSKDLSDVADNPLEDANIAYALHFYAGSHNATLRNKVDDFRAKDLAVFVSECGATDMTGDGDLHDEAFGRWVDYMDKNQISWVYWSYSNKDEGSAVLKADVAPDYSVEDASIDEYLSPSGELLKKMLERYR